MRRPFEYPPAPKCHKPPTSRTTIDGVTRCSGCGKVLDADDMVSISAKRTSKQGIPSQWNGVAPRRGNNSFEKGNRFDERGLPYLDAGGKPLKIKEPFDKRDYSSAITIS